MVKRHIVCVYRLQHQMMQMDSVRMRNLMALIAMSQNSD